jgi:hypothetical protein
MHGYTQNRVVFTMCTDTRKYAEVRTTHVVIRQMRANTPKKRGRSEGILQFSSFSVRKSRCYAQMQCILRAAIRPSIVGWPLLRLGRASAPPYWPEAMRAGGSCLRACPLSLLRSGRRQFPLPRLAPGPTRPVIPPTRYRLGPLSFPPSLSWPSLPALPDAAPVFASLRSPTPPLPACSCRGPNTRPRFPHAPGRPPLPPPQLLTARELSARADERLPGRLTARSARTAARNPWPPRQGPEQQPPSGRTAAGPRPEPGENAMGSATARNGSIGEGTATEDNGRGRGKSERR